MKYCELDHSYVFVRGDSCFKCINLMRDFHLKIPNKKYRGKSPLFHSIPEHCENAPHNIIPFSSVLDRRVVCSFLNLIICLFLLQIQASLRSSCTELCAYKTTEHISNSIITMSVLINIKEIVSSSDSTSSKSFYFVYIVCSNERRMPAFA